MIMIMMGLHTIVTIIQYIAVSLLYPFFYKALSLFLLLSEQHALIFDTAPASKYYTRPRVVVFRGVFSYPYHPTNRVLNI